MLTFFWTGCVCLVSMGGCATAQYGRIGVAIKLPSGAPTSTCEREEWHALVHARLPTSTVRPGGGVQTHYHAEAEGFGVFRAGEDSPEALEDVWQPMRQPKLQRTHEARIKPVDDAAKESLHWVLGSLVAMGAGAATAAVVQKQSGTAAAVAGLGGAGLSLVGLVVSLSLMPTPEEEMRANLRRQLLFPEEDDMKAAAAGVDRMNRVRRQHCQRATRGAR